MINSLEKVARNQSLVQYFVNRPQNVGHRECPGHFCLLFLTSDSRGSCAPPNSCNTCIYQFNKFNYGYFSLQFNEIAVYIIHFLYVLNTFSLFFCLLVKQHIQLSTPVLMGLCSVVSARLSVSLIRCNNDWPLVCCLFNY